jgi:hypothetical protein
VVEECQTGCSPVGTTDLTGPETLDQDPKREPVSVPSRSVLSEATRASGARSKDGRSSSTRLNRSAAVSDDELLECRKGDLWLVPVCHDPVVIGHVRALRGCIPQIKPLVVSDIERGSICVDRFD